jgi:hypothetical protein
MRRQPLSPFKSPPLQVEHDVYETRLLQVKGRRNVRVHVCKVDVAALNSGDVFILDHGLTLYQVNSAGVAPIDSPATPKPARRLAPF